MQFVNEFGIFVLGTFLTFSNMLAGHIEHALTPNQSKPIPIETEVPTNESVLTKMASQYEKRTIPDILLKNNLFQSANTIGSTGSVDATATDPAEAMVNIFCTHTTDEKIHTTTGSGFFISRSGAVLTNAHVAQTLLLENADRAGTTTCQLRTGNPATSTYEAELLYIPPAWIQAHAELINAEDPMGTGERDYALLYASSRIDSQPLPAVFPHLTLNTSPLNYTDLDTEVFALGYPATILQEKGATTSLPLVVATSTLTELYTFSGETADLLSISETAVAQGGSSGGPVMRDGAAIGMIVTQGLGEDDGLRALSMPYINATLEEETGFPLADYTRGDIAYKARIFQSALAPFLLQLLEFELDE